jgi:hypothetical protein
MSALSIQVPFPVFQDRDGQPLDNGYVWIGEPNLNPQTNPVVVYFDEALTIPAAQPLRTLNGYISRSGSPAQIYVDGVNFSILVQDSKGSMVYNFPDGTGIGAQASGVSFTGFKGQVGFVQDLADNDGSNWIGYDPDAAGSVARSAQEKMQDFVSINDFGASGNGVSDDTLPMTAFFNSAIANPGVEHRLDAKTYAISAVLPTINKSNVKIIGEGSEIHDTGVLITGTVLKWIGASGTVGPLVKISAISGASNQRLANVTFEGIGIDCASGAIDYGIEILSIRDSVIDVAVANAGFAGVQIDVVGSLGEAKDVQKCKIRITSRQIEKRNAFCLVCGGDAVANTSLNEFWVDAQITDQQAIYLVNSDNNDWNLLRVFRAAGGTATEGVSCLGGANSAERCRGERFWYYTSTVAIHVYGTSGSPSFAVGSVGHSLFVLDTENGTPAPIVEVGGEINWRKDVSAMSDNPWESYTPTISASSGTITTSSANMRYIRRGNVVYFKAQITITTNGTGSGTLQMTMPIAQVGSYGTISTGLQRVPTGYSVVGWVDGGGSTTMIIKVYDGTYPGASGAVIEITGFYEVT